MPDAASPLVETVIEAPAWSEVGLSQLAETAAVSTLSYLGAAADGFQIALLGCDDARIAELNGSFRDKPQPTNVLSWPSEDRIPGDLPDQGLPEDPTELGDIAIAYETCLREAKAANLSLADHTTHLIVHAVLHLLGYDHLEDAEAEEMEAKEIEILATLGLADPYS